MHGAPGTPPLGLVHAWAVKERREPAHAQKVMKFEVAIYMVLVVSGMSDSEMTVKERLFFGPVDQQDLSVLKLSHIIYIIRMQPDTHT